MDPITEVTVATRTVPLAREIRLGGFVVRERTYAIVRIRTRSGLVGNAYAQTRGAPIAAVIEALFAGALVGADAGNVEGIWRSCFSSTMGVGRTGLVVRALSLIDIALWDIRAQHAGQPLYQVLGGTERDVPVLLVAGYPQTSEDVGQVVATACEGAANGHSLIKIARASDPSVTRDALSQLAGALPAATRIVVDGSWFWTDPEDAAREIATWAPYPIAWVEDPFAPEDSRAYGDLRRRVGAPIGVGDEVTDVHAFEHLVAAEGLDILRLDIATIGGITPALEVIEKAAGWNVPVSLHISPETSIHIAAAFPSTLGVETFVRSGNPYDLSHKLCDGGPTFRGGMATPSPMPGLGFRIH
jgi:L-alanine-DL-glutamate epimerase-like enolase superfamily enzyme